MSAIDSSQTALVNYDAMCRAIDAAYELDEIKDIRDKAMALQLYMRQIRNTESEDRCYQIRMRAQRRAGELSKQIPSAQGQRSDFSGESGEVRKSKVLEGAGISTQQASDWERLAE